MRRHIKNNMDRSDYEFRKPTFGDVFDGIKEGDLSFHFAQLMYYWGTNDGQKPEPIISLAYWIGRQLGRLQAPQEEMRLDRYRDTISASVDQQAIDRWIVIHLHISPQGNPPTQGVLS
ncbi:hypothetical protein BS50DRAFT_582233 [Corynespora cassiicola Philippines]|uniref:Uncharacterized protein n=1 Tax=Corynespora cassiicola Philippines TaxID=1448308 RepID=A0A2T2PE53_CORCC|nr:hypothetical protein BS50DRAFT_582233 [Corynespora cassiicola Philippines]